MVQDQSKLTLYPSKDVVTLEKRADGGWNLHNDDTGSTLWNVTNDEVERLIAYQKNTEARDLKKERIELAALALEIDVAFEAATKHNDKLNAVLSRKKARETHAPIVLPTTPASVEEFMRYLNNVGFEFYVTAYTAEQVAKARTAYSVWSGGVELPLECVREHFTPNASNFAHYEWFIKCAFEENMPCSMPILESGSVGKGRTGGPAHGLRQGSKVNFSFTETVEGLVRAGLRAEV